MIARESIKGSEARSGCLEDISCKGKSKGRGTDV